MKQAIESVKRTIRNSEVFQMEYADNEELREAAGKVDRVYQRASRKRDRLVIFLLRKSWDDRCGQDMARAIASDLEKILKENKL
jgi:hypothetical protein